MGGTPTVLGDISTEWLSEVLHTRVTGFSLQVIGAGEGFMGQLARVSLVGDNVPASVIVKFPTSDPGGQVMGEMMGVWNREHRFYTEVASQIQGIKLARCLHSSVDPYALVLEDLSPARSGDQVAGPTPDQARAIGGDGVGHTPKTFLPSETPCCRQVLWPALRRAAGDRDLRW